MACKSEENMALKHLISFFAFENWDKGQDRVSNFNVEK